jgi:hypothetical protein
MSQDHIDAIDALLRYVSHDVIQLVQETIKCERDIAGGVDDDSLYAILADSAETLGVKHQDDSFYENMVRNSALSLTIALAAYASRDDSQ